MANRRGRALLIWLLVAVSACSTDTGPDVAWDLTEQPTKGSLGWDSRFDDVWNIDPIGDIRVVLPSGGEYVDTDDAIHDASVGYLESRDAIVQLSLDSHPVNVDDAATLLVAMIDSMGFDPGPVTPWVDRVRTQSEAGVRGPDLDQYGTNEGTEDPVVLAATRYSFDDDQPFIVYLEVRWALDTDG